MSLDARPDPERPVDEVDYDQEVQEFYDRHVDEVTGYLRNVGTPDEHLDHIVNDAFLAVRRRWTTLRTGNPRAYAFKVARNQRNRRLGGDIKRNGRTVVGLPSDHQRDPALEARDHADAIVDRLALMSALAALPDSQRQVVVLRKIIGLSTAETAEVLTKPEGTIKSDLSRGLAALKKLLNADEEAKKQ